MDTDLFAAAKAAWENGTQKPSQELYILLVKGKFNWFHAKLAWQDAYDLNSRETDWDAACEYYYERVYR